MLKDGFVGDGEMPFSSLNGILGPEDLDTLHRVLTRATADLHFEDRDHLAAILIVLRQRGVAGEDELYSSLMEQVQFRRTG